jgi:phospholipase/carboxylesterase
MPGLLPRRSLLSAAAVAGLAACANRSGTRPPPPLAGPTLGQPTVASSPLRLLVRADPGATPALPGGTSAVRLATGREALLHVPDREARGLVVALHGAGGQARSGLDLLRAQADRLGFVVLAPSSAASTWGAIRGGNDADTPALGAVLADVLARHPVDPQRLGVAGFSDGASYALTLGLANGDVFRRVVAFSPGFEAADARRGEPEFFVTHGIRDDVLPIERTSRRIVPELRGDGYEVTYREFDGPHVVPPDLASAAAEWLVR